MKRLMTRENIAMMAAIWLTIYPSVLVLDWALAPLGLPFPVETLLSTSITVPIITFVVVPLVKSRVADPDG